MEDFGISLTGGGARGSYQAGVLKAVSEVLKEQGLTGKNNPFKNFVGVSAGAINASYCASRVDELDAAAERLIALWENISPKNVYQTDFASLSRIAMKWSRDLALGPLFKNKLARSLLDTTPLWDLVAQIDFESIEKNLTSGALNALGVSAYSYTDNRTITFLQTHKDILWDKPRRCSRSLAIRKEHVMASCAIPLLFPSIAVNDEYFGDGSFRNMSPISPIIHMGSKKILMIGVRGTNEFSDRFYHIEPGIAKVSGVMLNALFFDTIDIDLERVAHINEFVKAMKADITTHRSDYTALDYRVIRPSRDMSKLAAESSKSFPRIVKFLIGGLGSPEESAELASYLLFVPEFTRKLTQLGYEDFYKQKNEFIYWLESKDVP